MIRQRMSCSHLLPVLTVCTAFFAVGCDRSAPSPTAEAPPVTAATSGEKVPVEMPDSGPSGPSVLTELDETARSAVIVPSGLCSFDAISGQAITNDATTVVVDPAAFVVSGWVGDRGTMTRPDANVRLTQAAGGRMWEITAGPAKRRGDVARHFNNDGLQDAGFEAAIDLSALSPGEYGLSMVHENGGRRFVCDKGAKVRIEG